MPSSRGSSRLGDRIHIYLHLLHCRWILYPLSHLRPTWLVLFSDSIPSSVFSTATSDPFKCDQAIPLLNSFSSFDGPCCSVAKSRLTLRPHGLQHTQPPCALTISWSLKFTCSSSRPVNQWCHPTISFSVIPFSSCLQPFPVSGSFQMSQLFASGGQSIGASASTSKVYSGPYGSI